VVVPLSGAGHLRVTHPSATLTFRRIQRIPFDLHALGTPLAFILSQDQTLHKENLYPWYYHETTFIFFDSRTQALLSCFHHSSIVKVLYNKFSSWRISREQKTTLSEPLQLFATFFNALKPDFEFVMGVLLFATTSRCYQQQGSLS
jgi:hypothetical protein